MDNNKILYIDDDINMLNTGEDLLINDGYEVSLAKSGVQAIKILNKSTDFNLILLDIDMPQMDGYETFEEIRKIEGCEDIPIIFLTGMDSPDYEIKGLKMGAADFVTKPFVKDVLLARVRNKISKYSAPGAQEYDQDRLIELESILTPSEIGIAKLVAKGYSSMEIADKLNYSYGYVKKVVSIILDKMDLTKRTEIRVYLKNE